MLNLGSKVSPVVHYSRVNNQISDTRLNRTPARQICETWRRGLSVIAYLSPHEAWNPNDGQQSPDSTGVTGSKVRRPKSSMTGHFNYSSDMPYVDVPSQLLVFQCEVFVLPLARRIWPLTPTVHESRCATKLCLIKNF